MHTTGLLEGQVPDQWLIDSSLHVYPESSRLISTRTDAPSRHSQPGRGLLFSRDHSEHTAEGSRGSLGPVAFWPPCQKSLHTTTREPGQTSYVSRKSSSDASEERNRKTNDQRQRRMCEQWLEGARGSLWLKPQTPTKRKRAPQSKDRTAHDQATNLTKGPIFQDQLRPARRAPSSLLRHSRQSHARPSSTTSSGGHIQKETSPDCPTLPRLSPSPSRQTQRRDRRAAHNSSREACSQVAETSDAFPTCDCTVNGRREHPGPSCLLDCERFPRSIEEKGWRPPTSGWSGDSPTSR